MPQRRPVANVCARERASAEKQAERLRLHRTGRGACTGQAEAPVPTNGQTKTPPEINRGGVFATVWLPVAIQAQYLLTLQPILHVRRARLLRFPVSANLMFPQGPSGRSGDLINRSPFMLLV